MYIDYMITNVRYDQSIGDLLVTVEPYRTTDSITGDAVEVATFYGNGGLITAEGFRVRKNGALYARRQVITVRVPAAVREALGR